jgi:regulatory protein
MDLRTAIYRYCNYQERAHQEVRNRLYELGATPPEVESLIAELIEADLLNEERFARSYARGKFRIKKWGRIKITAGLKSLRVSEYCIKKGLKEIDGDEYWNTLKSLAQRWWEHYKGTKPEWARRAKTHQYLLSRGYETSLVAEAITEILQTPR